MLSVFTCLLESLIQAFHILEFANVRSNTTVLTSVIFICKHVLYARWVYIGGAKGSLEHNYNFNKHRRKIATLCSAFSYDIKLKAHFPSLALSSCRKFSFQHKYGNF